MAKTTPRTTGMISNQGMPPNLRVFVKLWVKVRQKFSDSAKVKGKRWEKMAKECYELGFKLNTSGGSGMFRF